jgi:hypothetical protein
MKRTSLFVGLALVIVFAATLMNVNPASGWLKVESLAAHDHGQNQHSNHLSNAQGPQPFVNGATNPGAIPDSAAREIVLRLLTSDELNEGAKRAYLKEVGFNEGASAALTFAAHDFKRQTEQIEKEASEIKDRTWPTPDKATLDQLAGLQRQKEAILANNAAELEGRLRSFNALANWENHIMNRVKRKTKGFQVGMPTKKIGFLQRITDPFAAYAQAPGCDANVFVYSDVYVDWEYFIVYGTGSYSVPSNNCGHTFSQSTILWGPGGTGGWENNISLDRGDHFLDGHFQSNTSLEGFCPVVSQTFNAGGNANDMNLGAFVSIGPLTPSGGATSVKVGTKLICIFQARGSTGSGGLTFSVNMGAINVSGGFGMEVTGSEGTQTIPTTTNKTLTLSADFKPTEILFGPARFKGQIDVSSSNPNLTVKGGQRETGTITIVP